MSSHVRADFDEDDEEVSQLLKSVPLTRGTLVSPQERHRMMHSQSMLPEISADNVVYHPIASQDFRVRQKN